RTTSSAHFFFWHGRTRSRFLRSGSTSTATFPCAPVWAAVLPPASPDFVSTKRLLDRCPHRLCSTPRAPLKDTPTTLLRRSLVDSPPAANFPTVPPTPPNSGGLNRWNSSSLRRRSDSRPLIRAACFLR